MPCTPTARWLGARTLQPRLTASFASWYKYAGAVFASLGVGCGFDDSRFITAMVADHEPTEAGAAGEKTEPIF